MQQCFFKKPPFIFWQPYSRAVDSPSRRQATVFRSDEGLNKGCVFFILLLNSPTSGDSESSDIFFFTPYPHVNNLIGLVMKTPNFFTLIHCLICCISLLLLLPSLLLTHQFLRLSQAGYKPSALTHFCRRIVVGDRIGAKHQLSVEPISSTVYVLVMESL